MQSAVPILHPRHPTVLNAELDGLTLTFDQAGAGYDNLQITSAAHDGRAGDALPSISRDAIEACRAAATAVVGAPPSGVNPAAGGDGGDSSAAPLEHPHHRLLQEQPAAACTTGLNLTATPSARLITDAPDGAEVTVQLNGTGVEAATVDVSYEPSGTTAVCLELGLDVDHRSYNCSLPVGAHVITFRANESGALG